MNARPVLGLHLEHLRAREADARAVQVPGQPDLEVGLALLSQTEHSVDWGFLMAGSALASLPVLAAFLAFQRHILSGVLAGSEK